MANWQEACKANESGYAHHHTQGKFDAMADYRGNESGCVVPAIDDVKWGLHLTPEQVNAHLAERGIDPNNGWS